jgi:hypothetical protein
MNQFASGNEVFDISVLENRVCVFGECRLARVMFILATTLWSNAWRVRHEPKPSDERPIIRGVRRRLAH